MNGAFAMRNLIDFDVLTDDIIRQEPYCWGWAKNIFHAEHAAAMVSGFPRDNFKEVAGYDGEKNYRYLARSLVHMGAREATHREQLSSCWRRFADEVKSAEFRAALTRLIQVDLAEAVLEVNVTEYSVGAHLGPHVDLREKIATVVFYFNDVWDQHQGGALHILKSGNMGDVAAVIPPLIGNAAILVRADNSWHAVSELTEKIASSRRSVNVIFHQAGSRSTMW